MQGSEKLNLGFVNVKAREFKSFKFSGSGKVDKHRLMALCHG